MTFNKRIGLWTLQTAVKCRTPMSKVCGQKKNVYVNDHRAIVSRRSSDNVWRVGKLSEISYNKMDCCWTRESAPKVRKKFYFGLKMFIYHSSLHTPVNPPTDSEITRFYMFNSLVIRICQLNYRNAVYLFFLSKPSRAMILLLFYFKYPHQCNDYLCNVLSLSFLLLLTTYNRQRVT